MIDGGKLIELRLTEGEAMAVRACIARRIETDHLHDWPTPFLDLWSEIERQTDRQGIDHRAMTRFFQAAERRSRQETDGVRRG